MENMKKEKFIMNTPWNSQAQYLKPTLGTGRRVDPISERSQRKILGNPTPVPKARRRCCKCRSNLTYHTSQSGSRNWCNRLQWVSKGTPVICVGPSPSLLPSTETSRGGRREWRSRERLFSISPGAQITTIFSQDLEITKPPNQRAQST